MKMDDMNKAFEKEGFEVTRQYITDEKRYYFAIRKNDVIVSDTFMWNMNLSNEVNNSRQSVFIKRLIRMWEKEYEKSNSDTKQRPYDLCQLKRDIAHHGDEAKLVVNDKVYPMRITEVGIDSSVDAIPEVSIDGILQSFVPTDTFAELTKYCGRDDEITRKVYNRVLNSVYGLPSAYTDGTGYIAAARGNGKSLLAMRQTCEMIVRSNPFAIEKVIFNGPATIVMWMDGTKTIVKCQDGDEFDPEKGLAMAISKKAFGNKGNYCDVFKKCLKDCDIYYETVNTDSHAGDIYNAYQKLLDTLNNKKATKNDLGIAMEEAIGYLGHALG